MKKYNRHQTNEKALSNPFRSAFFFLSCEQKINLNLNDEVDLLVVEGWLTNEAKPYTILLSRTAAVSSGNPFPKEVGAKVWIEDEEGVQFEALEVASGSYQTDSSQLVGEIGKRYRLRIELANSKVYLSDYEELMPIVPIDNLLLTQQTNILPSENLVLGVQFTDPAVLHNAYNWVVYQNGKQFRGENSLFILSDELINGAQYLFPFNGFEVFSGDSVSVQQLSISQEAYNYLLQVQIQTTQVGIPLSPSAAPIMGNIRNIHDENETVLGFFGVSALTSASTILP